MTALPENKARTKALKDLKAAKKLVVDAHTLAADGKKASKAIEHLKDGSSIEPAGSLDRSAS